MGIETTRALVINKVAYSETSLIVAALTPSEGMMSFFGRGYRKPTKRSYLGRDAVDSFSEMEITFFRSTGDLHSMRHTYSIDDFAGLRTEFERFECAAFGASLAFAFESHQAPTEYEALRILWKSLSDGSDKANSVLRFWFHVLASGGFLPTLSSCSVCGSRLNCGGGYSQAVGMHCAKCGGKGEIELTAGDLKYAAILLDSKELDSRLRIYPAISRKLISFLASVTVNAIGRPPKLLGRVRKICE